MSVKPIEGSTTSTRASPVQYTKRVPEKESVEIEVTTPEKFKYVEPINSAGIKIRNKNPKIKNGFEYHITQHRLQK